MNNLEHYIDKVNTALKEYMCEEDGYFKTLYASMNYSILAGGKRIRPVLMQLVYEVLGGKEEISPYLCAIEMVHTYSLIHDDLPAMDDDDLRRGKPTNHKVYGEAVAILAGDALLTRAFEIMLHDALTNESMSKLHAAYVLSKACGAEGMVGGQVLDMESEGKAISLETLDAIQLNKTGALIAAATKMGAVLAGAAAQEVAVFEAYGKYIGKVFQIVDDILDETSTAEELGKPIKSDEKNKKNTYLSFYSIEESYNIAEDYTKKALAALNQISGDTTILRQIALKLIQRRN